MKAAQSPLFLSKTDEWETPDNIFVELDKEFEFTLDVAATTDNTKCKKYFTKEINGLNQDWSQDICWMNPPYSQISAWMEKAYLSWLGAAEVVCLVPSRTDTKWWHNYAMRGEIRFIKGRITFVGGKYNAPFPSAVVIFRGHPE